MRSMLKRLDIYIIKKYFVTFFFSAFLFTVIAVVIDFSERVQKFIDNGLSTRQVISEYYVHFVPYINGILWPLFALLAVVFFTSRLAKNSEIIAALSAGVSFNRLLRPYLIASGLLACVHFVGSHYFIPKGNKTFIAFDNKYIHPGNQRTKTENIHIFLDANSKIFIRNYRSLDTSMRSVFLEAFENDALVKLITAERMEWLGPPSRWRLRQFETRIFDGKDEHLINGRHTYFDTTINLVPEDFVRYTNQREMMTSLELREFIAYEKAKGLGTARRMATELHRRSADPYTLIVLTIIGVAVAARKTRGGVGVHLAIGVMIGALYIILSRFATTIASNLDLPAGISVWLPNVFFTLVALLLVLRAQK
jgi:lipopolysaccharide export system permease protein